MPQEKGSWESKRDGYAGRMDEQGSTQGPNPVRDMELDAMIELIGRDAGEMAKDRSTRTGDPAGDKEMGMNPGPETNLMADQENSQRANLAEDMEMGSMTEVASQQGTWLSDAQLRHYRRVLETEQKTMESLQHALEEGSDGKGGLNESFKESTGELSSYDNHPADHSDVTFERSKHIGLMDNNASLMGMIDDALAKIDQGVYGMCDHCGRPIPEERLEAFPYSTMCVDCKQMTEEMQAPRERPIEEDVLSTPFDRTFTDGQDSVIYDGEDAWQEVARYGTSNAPVDVPGAKKWGDTYYDADEEHGMVDWADAIVDDGFLEEFEDDEHTGQISRYQREEYERKD